MSRRVDLSGTEHAGGLLALDVALGLVLGKVFLGEDSGVGYHIWMLTQSRALNV